ncbi:MAG: energy transducer TonB, partial [Bacillota bacterium]
SYEMNPAAEMYSDQLPQPVGGYEALIDRVDYPSLALNAKVEGNVLAKITLDENGNVEDVQLVKSIGAGCDESVIKAIKDTKFIYPSNYEGSTVLNQFNIMFRFSLK